MENSNQTILVIGATGNQGGAVARHLLQRGDFTVCAFVRNLNKPAAQALKQAGAYVAPPILSYTEEKIAARMST